ncbi:hypothetical protein WMY93_012511 [Mugilogobius chulae]|uniref:DRBM domain-containing protein n=1 Tax=Mugilogobius chulae TaxID=88201 RepID=A0AAW0P5X9_9GOBI
MSTASYKNHLTQVNDLATKHHLSLTFGNCQDYGPVHKKTFFITLQVGTLTAVGQGNTKKEARTRAASNILQPLKQMCLSLQSNNQTPVRERSKDTLLCSRNPQDVPIPMKRKQTFSEGLQPCGCLSEVVQARGMKYPEYTLLESKRLPWGWLFTMKVSVPGASAVGTGPTKKAAKNNAAAQLLKILGFQCPKYNPLLEKQDSNRSSQDSSTSSEVCSDNKEITAEYESQEVPEPTETETDQGNKTESVTEECRPSTDLEAMDEAEMNPQTKEEIPVLKEESQHVEAEIQSPQEELEQTEEIQHREEIQPPQEDSQHTEAEIQSPEEDLEQTEEIQSSEEETEYAEEIQPTEEILSSEVIQVLFQQEEDPTLVFVSLSEVPLQTDPEECECETQDQKLSLYDAEVFSQSQDMTTPECDQECSPEQPEVFHQVDTGSEEQSETQCEEAQVTDLISLSQVFCNIQIGSEEQSLCKTLDLSSSPSAEVVFGDGPEEAPAPDGHTQVFKEADILPLKSNQECQKPSSETHVIKESTEQEEHNSPPQILDGPPVSHFLIQALVRKLTQKSYFNSEDQGKIVNLLLEQTKDRILNQNVPISVHNMRAVAKTAAKDLMKEIKLQKMPLKAEDEVFQEAMLKHLNTRLSNFLFGPKKRGLSRLFSAVRELFHST